MSAISNVDHVTLRCTPQQLSTVQAFYEDVVGLRAGPRPAFDFPGAWLYAGDAALVHLAAVLDEVPAGVATILSSRPGSAVPAGPIDHFALRMKGSLLDTRSRLQALQVPFAEAPVPDWPLRQVFLVDPLGVKVELNFVMSSEVEPTP